MTRQCIKQCMLAHCRAADAVRCIAAGARGDFKASDARASEQVQFIALRRAVNAAPSLARRFHRNDGVNPSAGFAGATPKGECRDAACLAHHCQAADFALRRLNASGPGHMGQGPADRGHAAVLACGAQRPCVKPRDNEDAQPCRGLFYRGNGIAAKPRILGQGKRVQLWGGAGAMQTRLHFRSG